MNLTRRGFMKMVGLASALGITGLPGKGARAEVAAKAGYRKIGVEEHYSTPEHIELLRSILERKYPSPKVLEEEKNIVADAAYIGSTDSPAIKKTLEQLCDLGSGRIAEMDKYKIDMQILSLTSPGLQVFEPEVGTTLSRRYNDIVSEAVKEHPKRFAGLACLAPQNPVDAANELQRAVRQLGLKGAMIDSHTKGEYLDDKKYWPIFETAQQLNVPIYLHPRGPSPGMIKPFLGYPMLSASMWGFGAEVSVHALRLICSGLFDQYPGLKIVLGHLGETIPFMIDRIDDRWSASPTPTKLKKLPGQYFKENFFVATSGMTSHQVLSMVLAVLGADNIMFAADYPMENVADEVNFLDTAPVSDTAKEKISHLNAERLFSLS